MRVGQLCEMFASLLIRRKGRPCLRMPGGIVPVSAHLLNRRYGCLCGCCSSEVTEGNA